MMHHAAITFMRVGDNDAAIALLERLSTMPNYVGLSPAELRMDPLWDPLRRQARFQRLIARDRRPSP
ncbi:MAG: hypothetical protein U0132_13595 [Gemmatimonadaceae bacterium]